MSNLTFGYRGPQVIGSSFASNPLGDNANPTIQLCDYEVAAALQALGAASWDYLNPSQKRQVARMILQQRGDVASANQLAMLGLNNPNFNHFEIITTTGQA